MLKSYFITALRSLLRNRTYSLINVLGLALGITTCIIIFLLLKYEMSYDKSFANASSIYRVVRNSNDASGLHQSSVTPYPAGAALKNDFPDLLSTQFHFAFESLMTIDADKRRVQNIVFADTSFFDVFNFEVVSGNPKKDLAQPGKIYLTEQFAKTLPNPNVKRLKLDNLLEFEVAGIIRMPETPTHIAINMIASRASLTSQVATQFMGFSMDQWGLNSAGFSYVVLPPSQTKAAIEARFIPFVKKYYQPDDAVHETYLLQPISDIHFATEFDENPGTAAIAKSQLVVLACIGLFILVIACVNFINLATALSIRRSREVGIRKTLGAKGPQLTLQYLGEAVLISITAGIFALMATQLLLPWVNTFLNRSLSANWFSDLGFVSFFLGTIAITALLSGSYPALVLSRLNPVRALKNKAGSTSGTSIPLRKVLVVLQFFIAQVLIISTLVVASQLSYFRTRPLGFAKDAIINVNLPDHKPEKLEAMRNNLLANSDIQEISFSLGAPTSGFNFGTGMFLTAKGDAQRFSVNIKPIDSHYKNVYGLELIEGRWFTESDDKLGNLEKSKYQWSYIVNETAVKTLGFASPKDIIGQSITIGFNDTPGPVIGVVKDFYVTSLHSELRPVVMLPFNLAHDAGIKISSQNRAATLKKIEAAFTAQYPEYLFEYTFLDQFIQRLYQDEEKMFTLFEIFAGIAIFIGCLGLYGLASFMAEQRTKEIAIRKSLGASAAQIIQLFSKEFVVLILVAFIIAAPVAWYGMRQWLQGFANHVAMSWVVFAIGIFSTVLIASITVGYRSLVAAKANPVDSLKNE